MRRPPPGFEAINDKLDEYEAEMRLALADDPSQAQLPAAGRSANKSRSATSVAAGKEGKASGHEDCENEGNSEQTAKPVPPLWRVARINHERTRYVFNACYREKTISSEVLSYCCEMNFIDAGLVRRWKLPGYERLCCTACCVPGTASAAARLVSKHANRHKTERRSHDDDERGGTCICRVPAERRRIKHLKGCTVCGCTGCSSGEKREREEKKSEEAPVEKLARTESEQEN
ncbi:putative G10 protein [Trypanosoma grayi]|uniref:putative G10 protein n=1 Tax=Trypanosoma grayi TaxID=71804 RepID=UPI0004F45DF3|nr:putative G10 protein [Trypanosoma grayi]KEG10868.1 putative G10 protein [Trypanosoma grayi]